MGKRTIVLVVALLLAAVSGFSVWRYLDTLEDKVRRDIDEVQVFRATEAITQGTSGTEAKAAHRRERGAPGDRRPRGPRNLDSVHR